MATLNAWGWRRIRRTTGGLRLLARPTDKFFYTKNQLRPLWQKDKRLKAAIEGKKSGNVKLVFRLLDDLLGAGFDHLEHRTLEAFVAHHAWLVGAGLSGQLEVILTGLREAEVLDDDGTPTEDAGPELFKRFGRFWVKGARREHVGLAEHHVRGSEVLGAPAAQGSGAGIPYVAAV